MKKKLLIILAIIVVVGIGSKFLLFKGDGDTSNVYAKEAVSKGDIEAVVDTTGTLNPVTIVDIGSQVSGRIFELFADFNTQVTEGQIIAKLDPELFLTRVNQNEANYKSAAASVEKAQISLANAEKKHRRSLNLFEKNLISYEEKEDAETLYFSAKSDLQAAEARLEQAKSTLESSKVDLKNTVIKSPIDGVVITRNFNVGQTVAASFQAPVLFQIANDLTKMQVECSVDEADIGKVQEGQKVRFTVDAFPDEKFGGMVSQVRYSPEVISNVVTYTTIVEVANPEIKLRPGMTATVSIVVGEAKNKLRVPNAALRYNPSMEVMMAAFEKMRGGAEAHQGDGQRQTRSMRDVPSSNREDRGQGGMSMMADMRGGPRKNTGRVWIEDEEGNLNMVFLKTGVTDNIYTEIVGGALREGQEVVTGEDGGSQDSSRRNNLMRGMMFMRR